MPATTSHLAQKIAREIVCDIAEGRIGIGGHLGAQPLADRFGVSRSPVSQALNLLAQEGYLEQLPNRGFFVRAVREAQEPGSATHSNPFDPPNDYQRIAEDWLNNRISAEATEQTLRARYGLTKAELNGILLRASREGWAERKQGYGWRFLPVAKTTEAFEQIYRFRMLIEPAAMFEPTFRVDRAALAEQRDIQQRMLDADIERLSGERLLENGALFHEELIKFSGNPFFHQALVRVNRMRRLMEYRSRVDRRRLYVQCSQHIEIVDLLERGEVMEASRLMRRHLDGALAIKSPVTPLSEAGEKGRIAGT
jgi:DNA-binding GntR family transcriptional regulator